MSLSTSDVSVVIVNWNGREHLGRLLPSLLPLEAGEVILVDNGSRDDSVDFVKAHYSQVRILENSVNQGFAQPNNAAAQVARGKVLAFINNDMRCHPEWLEAALAKLEGTDCVASRILDWEGKRIDFHSGSLQYLGYALQQEMGEDPARVSSPDLLLFPCGGAMLIGKELFLEVGGFDEDFFAIFEDVDLGWRLWLLGYEVKSCPGSMVYHRGHGTFQEQSSARMRYLMHRNALLTIIKNYGERNLQAILPAAVVQAIRRAVRLSGVRKESYYLWSEAENKARSDEPAASGEIEDAWVHLVALEDALALLPRLMEKRNWIQQRRKRSDDEILPLLREPLRPIVQDREYVENEAALLKLLGLDRLFDTRGYAASAHDFPEHSFEKAKLLREELRQLQWIAGKALTQPPSIPPSRPHQLRELLKRRGLAGALRSVLERLRGGV